MKTGAEDAGVCVPVGVLFWCDLMKTRFERYHVGVKDAPPKFKIPTRFIVERYNNCANVLECTQACIYGVHVLGKDNKIAEPINELCRGCYVCVQKCPDLAISVKGNPEFHRLGNSYFTPERMRTIYFEAETGRVPVSGTGYNGPFAGRGFDGIWFDFSEIVRPTRDGIHGREYISTSIDLGRKLPHLLFGKNGELISGKLDLVEIPIPTIFDAPTTCVTMKPLLLAVAKAASKLGTLATINLKDFHSDLLPYISNILLRFSPDEIEAAEDLIRLSRIVEVNLLDGSPDVEGCLERIKRINPSVLVSFSSPYDEHASERACLLTEKGADVIHFYASDEAVEQNPDLMTSAIHRIHSYLVEKNLRDEVTLVSSGGVAEASHVPKSIILGADAVGIGLAYEIALGCKVCYGNQHSGDCQLKIEDKEVEWAVQRIINLVGSWRDQLLEVLGGMGLREVRRQRGEMGRAMFYQDLETKIFGGKG
jgi:NAD-dependent dihydropyrimidine dehydrogenase PreA subunit